MSTDDQLVRLEGAGLFRAGRWLVRDVDMTVARGEIVTLIGPNGSGKSTTARLALGIVEPDAGTASIAPRTRIGFVPQSLKLDWTVPLSVDRFMRLSGNPSRQEVEQALERTGVTHLKSAQVHTLSGGEFQKVLLARAIARKPDLLVLDEPVQGVDFSGETEIYNLITAIRDETGCGVLLISHDLHIVMAATDRVICMNGHVCCQGTPRAVASNEEYKRLFGARAATAYAVYEHQHDHTHMPDGSIVSGCDHEDHDHA